MAPNKPGGPGSIILQYYDPITFLGITIQKRWRCIPRPHFDKWEGRCIKDTKNTKLYVTSQCTDLDNFQLLYPFIEDYFVIYDCEQLPLIEKALRHLGAELFYELHWEVAIEWWG